MHRNLLRRALSRGARPAYQLNIAPLHGHDVISHYQSSLGDAMSPVEPARCSTLLLRTKAPPDAIEEKHLTHRVLTILLNCLSRTAIAMLGTAGLLRRYHRRYRNRTSERDGTCFLIILPLPPSLSWVVLRALLLLRLVV